MRISTTMLVRSILISAVVLALVPQSAFAQLPLETRELKLQGTTSGSLIMKPAAATTPYALTYPSAIGSVGSFMYIGATDGTLKWSNAAGGDNYVPIWDADLPGGGGIVWVDPAGASNPNWGLTGNTLSADGTLGTKNGFAINVTTNNNTRMTVASDGAIAINTTATGGSTTTIGRTAGHTTAIDGTTNITGSTTILGTTNVNTTGTAVTTIGNTGAAATVAASTLTVSATTANITATTNVTGATTIVGTTNINSTGTAVTNIGNTSGGTAITGPIVVNGQTGNSGEVLVSKGAGNSPQWQSIASAVGIKKAGIASISGATTVTVNNVTGIAATDAIIVTLASTSGSAVVATVTNVTAASGPTTTGSFVVTLSASYTGSLHYMVLGAQN